MMTGVANKFKGGVAEVTTAFYNTLLLDGSTQYVDIPTGMDLSTNDFTISMDINLAAHTTDSILLSQWQTSGNQRSIDSYISKTNGTIVFNFSTNGSANFSVINTFVPSLDTWYNIIFERVGADLNTYIDGVLLGVPFNIGGSNIHSSTSFMRFGGTVTGFISHDGSVNNLTVIMASGVVSELQTVKQLDNYSTSITDNFLLGLPLNDGVVDPYIDRSVNGLDGTAVGSPSITIPQLEFDLT